MVVVEPDLDCDVLVRLGDVGVLCSGEGVVVVALVGEGVGVDKDGLARLDDAQPGATCSRLKTFHVSRELSAWSLTLIGPKLT